MEVKITTTKKAHKIYGKIILLEFPNESKIYISDKGWNLTLPKNKKTMALLKKKNKIEIGLSWEEIELAIRQSIKRK